MKMLMGQIDGRIPLYSNISWDSVVVIPNMIGEANIMLRHSRHIRALYHFSHS